MSREQANIDREAHIVGLMMEHNVDWQWGGRRGHATYARPRKGEVAFVWLPQIKGQMTYFIALHELGHVLSSRNRQLRMMDAEVDAWKWALANTEEEPTKGTWRGIDRRLKSYVARAIRRLNCAEPSDESRRFLQKIHELAA